MGSIYPLELLLDEKGFVDITLSSATSCSACLSLAISKIP